MKKLHMFCIALGLLVGMVGCASNPKVERIGAATTTDLSGKWNDTDSRLVSQEMVADLLSRPWLGDYRSRKGGPPAVIVGSIRNQSHEFINVRTFIADIERELINSGQVRFVASADERGQVREERKDQELHASETTRKAMGRELGADYMLIGTISTIIDAVEGEQTRFYQVDLELISLVDNSKSWIGQKKIKKFVEHSSLRP